MRAVETTHPDPAPVLEVFPTWPPRHCMPQQTRVPQMPPNPRAEQMRSRHFNLSPLRRSLRRVVAFVSLDKNSPNYGRNADRPHNRNEPPHGNRGPRHHAERTRRTSNQREANNRLRH
jgi:hypothetical protein